MSDTAASRRRVAFAPEPPGAGSLFGAEAVRFLTAAQHPAPAGVSLTDAEEALLKTVRERVGPYASDGLLRHFLRTSHGKAHWAVNGALREAVLAVGEDGVPAEFEPAAHVPLGAAGAPSSCKPGAEEEEAATACPLPVSVWELILARLDAPDVRSAARTCTTLRAAASSQALWAGLYAKRWGPWPRHGLSPQDCPAVHDHWDLGGTTPPCWRSAYSVRSVALGAMRCPSCSASPLIPIVFGYPSSPLVSLQRAGRVLLGGDYLLDRDPTWCCAQCGLQWRTWPWTQGGVATPVPAEARVAGAGAGAGVHFAI
jgi:hypothetical protein